VLSRIHPEPGHAVRRADLDQESPPSSVRSRTSGDREPEADLARRLGPAARVLLVVEPASAGAIAGEPAVEFFEAVGRLRARTLVLDLAGPESSVRRELGAAEAPGVTDVLQGRVRVADAVVRSCGSFMYVPPGRGRAPGGRLIRALSASGLLRQAREAGGTVLLHGRADDVAPPASWRAEIDGVVVPDGAHARRVDPRLPVLGTLARPESPPESPGGGGRRWPSSTPAPPPRRQGLAASSRSEMVFAADAPPLRGPRTRWWTIMVICVLAAALGFGLLSATQDGSWWADLMGGQDPVESTLQD